MERDLPLFWTWYKEWSAGTLRATLCTTPIIFLTTISPPMVGRRQLSLFRILDEGSPPPAIFFSLLKKWVPGGDDNVASKTSVRLLRASVNLVVIAWDEIRQAHHKLLCTLAGHHAKGFDRITFLAVDGDGLVSLFHSLF